MLIISPQNQRGLTLIESMVALLVISIGLLGIAAMQINSLKQNSSALWHSQAVLSAYDMADRIRANETEINNYIGIDTESVTTKDCTTPCTTSDLVDADATDWSNTLSALPSGRGIIRRTPDVAAGQLDVVVMWDDEGTGASGTDCGSDPDVDLTCYTVTMGILP